MKPLDQMSEEEFAQLVRQAVALPDAPPALQRAAIAQWETRPVPALQAAGRALLKRIVAALTFDSWAAGPLAHGVRSVPSDTRHLLFSAEGRDIDLRIVPAADRYVLTGQVLGPDDSGDVELTACADGADAAAPEHVATLDTLGEFRIDGIARGAYALTLRLGTDAIELPPIEVGERRR